MQRIRTIVRNSNRRFYDYCEHRYVTLADIRSLVVRRVEFSVIDKVSALDVTDRILLQVIVAQEVGCSRTLGRELLLQTIRCSEVPAPAEVVECSPKNLKVIDFHADNARSASPEHPSASKASDTASRFGARGPRADANQKKRVAATVKGGAACWRDPACGYHGHEGEGAEIVAEPPVPLPGA